MHENEAIMTEYPELRPKELTELAMILAQAKMPMLVIGRPGIGKTDIIKQVAETLGWNLIISHPVVDDPTDYKGMPFVSDGQAGFIPFADLKQLIEADQPTIHFADDFGHAPKLTQAAYMQMMLTRAINGKKISDHVVFFAASNRKEDKAGVSGMLEPLKDRYATIVELVANLEDWVGWAIGAGMPFELISYVRYRQEILTEWKPTSDFRRMPTPRSIASVGRMIQLNIPKMLQRRTFAGAIGKERASELVGFLDIYKNLPDPMDVILHPTTAMVPEEPAPLYALCGALASHATAQTIDAIITYADRLKPEFSVMLVSDATIKDRKGANSLCNNSSFIKWVHNHQDVLL